MGRPGEDFLLLVLDAFVSLQCLQQQPAALGRWKPLQGAPSSVASLMLASVLVISQHPELQFSGLVV